MVWKNWFVSGEEVELALAQVHGGGTVQRPGHVGKHPQRDLIEIKNGSGGRDNAWRKGRRHILGTVRQKLEGFGKGQ
jgi:hypothetical protein